MISNFPFPMYKTTLFLGGQALKLFSQKPLGFTNCPFESMRDQRLRSDDLDNTG